MLISIVMDPMCLAPEMLASPESRFGAERLLEGVITNGVLLASDSNQYVGRLASAVSSLGSQIGQRIQVLIAEISKSPNRFVADKRPLRSGPAQSIEEFQPRQLALALRADIVVCRDQPDVSRLSDLREQGIEVCTLAHYDSSRTEARRKEWLQTTRIDQSGQEADLVGRILRYATDIVVVDRFFGITAKKKSTGHLKKFVRGLIYMAECWKQHSPYACSRLPALHVLSIAGSTGAAGGYVDPKSAEAAIQTTVASLDKNRSVGKTSVSLKADKNPSIANDRFVSGIGRCFGVLHGIDDIGRLTLPQQKRRPTFLIPDSQDCRDLLSEIQALKSAS